MEMTIDKLIEILQSAKNELGGDTVIKLYNGQDYDTPQEAAEYYDKITSVQVVGTKSYFGQSGNNEDKTLFIKYEFSLSMNN